MSGNKINITRYLKSNHISLGSTSKIDEVNGIIHDVVLCKAGEAKGHGVHLDNSFINEVATQGNALSIGLKCRFGHPTMSSEALGTYMGRIKNVRTSDDGSSAIGDLHLDDSSKKSPSGDLFSYVIELAKNSPESFGMSIVFSHAGFYQFKEDGTRIDFESEWDRDIDEEKPLFITLKSLHGCDIVDEGAATDSLFNGAQFNQHAFAVRLSTFLDENQDIYEFASQNPDVIQKFMGKYNAMNNKRKISFSEDTSSEEVITEEATEETTVSTPEENPSTPEENPSTPEETTEEVEEPNTPSAPAQPGAMHNEEFTELRNQVTQLSQQLASVNEMLIAYGLTPAANHTATSHSDVLGDAGEIDFAKMPWNKKK